MKKTAAQHIAEARKRILEVDAPSDSKRDYHVVEMKEDKSGKALVAFTLIAAWMTKDDADREAAELNRKASAETRKSLVTYAVIDTQEATRRKITLPRNHEGIQEKRVSEVADEESHADLDEYEQRLYKLSVMLEEIFDGTVTDWNGGEDGHFVAMAVECSASSVHQAHSEDIDAAAKQCDLVYDSFVPLETAPDYHGRKGVLLFFDKLPRESFNEDNAQSDDDKDWHVVKVSVSGRGVGGSSLHTAWLSETDARDLAGSLNSRLPPTGRNRIQFLALCTKDAETYKIKLPAKPTAA